MEKKIYKTLNGGHSGTWTIMAKAWQQHKNNWEFWRSLKVMMMPKLSKKQLQEKGLFDPQRPSRMWSKTAEDRRGICHQQNP